MASAIGDLLAGAAGRPVDRQGLQAFVANSQAINGLRSAQTEEAMSNAQKLVEQQKARGQFEQALIGSGMDPSEAHMIATTAQAGLGDNFAQTVKGLGELQQQGSHGVLANPANLGTPAATAAASSLQGKIPEPVNVPGTFTMPAGMPQPEIHQTPENVAQTANLTAGAAQKNAAAAPDPQAIAFGAYMLYKTGKMPAMGMGGGPARMAIMSQAARLGEEEMQTGQPVEIDAFNKAISNGQDWTAANKGITAFGTGPQGNQVRALNNVVGHLQLFEGLTQQLNTGSFRPGNALDVLWQKTFGSPAPTNATAAGSIIGPELTKILTNTGSGSEAERTDFNKTAGNLANAPEQISGAIGTVKGMIARQATDYALQYHAATGRDDFAQKYLAPDVTQYLDMAPPHPTVAPGTTPPVGQPGAVNPLDHQVPTMAPNPTADNAAAVPAGTTVHTGLPTGAAPAPGAMPAGVPVAPAQPVGVTHAGAPLALKNAQGWVLQHDAQGNHAYVGPNNEIQEVQ